jgi:hypothetical protein
VSEFISCFACDQEPTQQCPRCGRPYCDDHGEELCDACLEPASGVPSFTLYRGSLLALLFGTLVAVWLLVQPADTSNEVRPQVVPTQQASGNTTPQAGTTPGANTTPQGSNTTPGANPTAAGATATRAASSTTPAAGNTPAGGGSTYTVASGDTLSTICAARKPASMSVTDCVDQVVALNGLSSAESISIGQSLRIPQ